MHSLRSLFGFDFVVFEGGEQKHPAERASDKLAGVTPGQNIVIFIDSHAPVKTISDYNLFPSELEFKCKQPVDSVLEERSFFNGSLPIAAFKKMNKPTSWPKRLRLCIHLVYRFLLEMPSDFSGINIARKEYLLLKSWLLVNFGLVYSMARDMLNFLFYLRNTKVSCTSQVLNDLLKIIMAESSYFSNIPSNVTYNVLGRDLLDVYFQYQTTIWTVVLLTPIVAIFFLPLVMMGLVYISALYLKAYRYYYKINGYTFTPECWKPARYLLACLWDFQARFWYGYEIQGLENIPSEGPALVVFYHGAMPVDWYYLLSKTVLYKKRLICAVGDRFLFHLPAFDALIDCFQIYPGTIETCADILKKGNLLAIAPGGVREALFGDEMYPIIWGTRKGFAKVAMEAKVPIIPVFTENIREAFFTRSFGKKWLRTLYERTRIPLVPIYGGFPTKLKTFVGEPIPYDPSITPDEMATRVNEKMKAMIKTHQKLPGSVTRSVFERFQYLFKLKHS
ncbi:transmembrane protein 68 [Trichonephila clavipes]|nr:transmembrane protein 68 [Trichonephila clavipes]